MGLVALVTVGMTVPAQAVGGSSAGSPSAADIAAVSSVIAAEAQSYTAPTEAHNSSLDRAAYAAASIVSAPVTSQLQAVPTEGGLTLAQAQALIADYVSTNDTGSLRKGEAVLEALYPGGTGPGDCGTDGVEDKLDNCVGFVTYFMNVYTSFDRYVFANGGGEARALASALGRSTSTTPSVYSVGSDSSTSAAGHTFVVLGIRGDEAIIGEAACGLTEGWPRARVVSLSALRGDTFVSVADLLLSQPRALAQLLGSSQRH